MITSIVSAPLCAECGAERVPTRSTGRVRIPLWECLRCRTAISRKAEDPKQGRLALGRGPRVVKVKRGLSEHQEQVRYFQWVDLLASQYPELKSIHSVPNGFYAPSIATAARMVAEGLRAGVEDISIDVARGPYHGARLETKVRGGRIEPAQAVWHARHRAEGYYVAVCWSCDELISETCTYLGIPASGEPRREPRRA